MSSEDSIFPPIPADLKRRILVEAGQYIEVLEGRAH